MNRLIRPFLTVISLLAILTGCGTTPNSHYYLLSSGVLQIPTGSTPSFGVGPVAIPEYLNRNAIIYKRKDNKLHIASFDRWAEPLDAGITRAIQMNLASLLNSQNVQSFPWSGNERPEYGVEVNILVLEANDTQARLVVEWRIYRPKGNKTVRRRMSELQQEMPTGTIVANNVEPAYSQLFFQLSEIIAVAISEDSR